MPTKKAPQPLHSSDKSKREETGSLSRRATKSSFDAYIAEIKDFPQLTREEEMSLGAKALRGDPQARKILIESNLKLVIAIAKRYLLSGVSIMDLIEEGNIGLMKAAERFDPAAECRFATYAGWWIRQTILRALANQTRTIRIPVYKYNLVCKYRKTKNRLRQELEREPTERELAREMEIPLTRVRELDQLLPAVVPLDSPMGDDEDDHLVTMIRDSRARIPSEVMQEIFFSEKILGLLETLGERERAVLEYRFGVEKDREYTLSEIGEILNISRERVRQIEIRALRRLREGFSLVEGRDDVIAREQEDKPSKTKGRRKGSS